MKNRDSFLYFLGELNSSEERRVVISIREGGQLIAELEKKDGKKFKRIKTILLEFTATSHEEALPILSSVEWDDEKEIVQQRIPVKYLMKSQRPRFHTHLYGYKRGRKTPRKSLEDFITDVETGKEEPFPWM